MKDFADDRIDPRAGHVDQDFFKAGLHRDRFRGKDARADDVRSNFNKILMTIVHGVGEKRPSSRDI
jgi:hypothetical protein